jgi:hypothetical protein
LHKNIVPKPELINRPDERVNLLGLVGVDNAVFAFLSVSPFFGPNLVAFQLIGPNGSEETNLEEHQKNTER